MTTTQELQKIPDHDKYIATTEFNKFMKENFAKRLKQATLASKSDIADLVKKTDFDEKLTNIYKRFASNKTKHVEVKKKLNDHTFSYTKLISDLLG